MAFRDGNGGVPLQRLSMKQKSHRTASREINAKLNPSVTNFIRPYLHQFFDDSHGPKASLKPLRKPFDRYQSRLEAINNGRDISRSTGNHHGTVY